MQNQGMNEKEAEKVIMMTEIDGVEVVHTREIYDAKVGATRRIRRKMKGQGDNLEAAGRNAACTYGIFLTL